MLDDLGSFARRMHIFECFQQMYGKYYAFTLWRMYVHARFTVCILIGGLVSFCTNMYLLKHEQHEKFLRECDLAK